MHGGGHCGGCWVSLERAALHAAACRRNLPSSSLSTVSPPLEKNTRRRNAAVMIPMPLKESADSV